MVETLSFGEDVPSCIARVARDQGASILVVGHGRTGSLVGLLLGSTAQALIQQSPCPILLVRPHR